MYRLMLDIATLIGGIAGALFLFQFVNKIKTRHVGKLPSLSFSRYRMPQSLYPTITTLFMCFLIFRFYPVDYSDSGSVYGLVMGITSQCFFGFMCWAGLEDFSSEDAFGKVLALLTPFTILIVGVILLVPIFYLNKLVVYLFG